MDAEQQILPVTLAGLQDENRGLREQLRVAREKAVTEEKNAKVCNFPRLFVSANSFEVGTRAIA